MYKISIVFISFILLFSSCYSSDEKHCDRDDSIYKNCNHETDFSEEEIENVRIYLKRRFKKTNPIRPPCENLIVRKDIKCLSKEELRNFTQVIRTLYKRGIVEKFAKLHSDFWPAVHKFIEAVLWHRWWNNELEKEMRKINPECHLPYWEIYTQFAEPEKSLAFDLFGHGGKKPDYCVTDGAFPNQMLNFPDKHCLRRQWYKDGTIPPWEPSEWSTSILQQGPKIDYLLASYYTFITYPITRAEIIGLKKMISDYLFPIDSTDPTRKPWLQAFAYMGFSAHFKTHLSCAGKKGDLGFTWAPNDILFILFHVFLVDNWTLKWQLQSDENLVPESYAFGDKYDEETGQVILARLDEPLTYYRNITVRETWQVGHGQLCSIPDVFIKPINEIMRKEKRELPKPYYKLKKALSDDAFKMYYPKFALQPENVTFWDYELPKVRSCNKNCELMPKALFFNSTPQGIALLERFGPSYGKIDITDGALAIEQYYYDFMGVMDQSGYCSPYVSSDWSKNSKNSKSYED